MCLGYIAVTASYMISTFYMSENCGPCDYLKTSKQRWMPDPLRSDWLSMFAHSGTYISKSFRPGVSMSFKPGLSAGYQILVQPYTSLLTLNSAPSVLSTDDFPIRSDPKTR